MEVTPGQGFFKYKELTYCGVCIRNCVNLEKDEKDRVDEFKIKDNNNELIYVSKISILIFYQRFH